MKQFLLAILVAVFSVCCKPTNLVKVHHVADVKPPIQILETVALVKWVDDGGNDAKDTDTGATLFSYCAGVWIAPHIIATANHCLKHHTLGDTILYSVFDTPGAAWDSMIMDLDPDKDLAILVGWDKLVPTHPIAPLNLDPYIGQHAVVVGHPSGMKWTLVYGNVSALRPNETWLDGVTVVDQIQIAAPIWFGNSGGGVFDEAGGLIGIASYMTSAPNMGFFIDARYLQKWAVGLL